MKFYLVFLVYLMIGYFTTGILLLGNALKIKIFCWIKEFLGDNNVAKIFNSFILAIVWPLIILVYSIILPAVIFYSCLKVVHNTLTSLLKIDSKI